MSARKHKLVVFKRRKGWYWRFVAPNNRTTAIGAEPFSSALEAANGFERVTRVLTYTVSVEKK